MDYFNWYSIIWAININVNCEIRNKGEKMSKKIKITKQQVKEFGIDLIWLVIGSFIGAVAVVGIMEPNGLSSGGIVGIIRMTQQYVDLNFSVMYYIAAAIVLLILYFTLGFKAVSKAIIVSLIYPTVTAVVEQFDFSILEEKDLILAAIFCGALQGISVGIISWRGYTFAGTDGLAKAIRKKALPHIPQNKIMSVMDAAVIIASAFVFDRNIALYALVTQVIITKTIDVVIYGMEAKFVQIEIITTMEEQVAGYILNEMKRGVTTTTVTGEYSKEKYAEMRLLCSTRESIELRRALAKIDPKAFVTLHKIDSVWGQDKDFQDIKKDDVA